MGHKRRPNRTTLIPPGSASQLPPVDKKKNLAIDLSNLPEPEPVGFANRFRVVKSEEHWEIGFFAKRQAQALPVFRVIVAVDSLLNFLQTGTFSYEENVRKSDPAGLDRDYLDDTMQLDAPTVAPQANILAMSRSGVSASLSLFFYTPFSHALSVRTGRPLKVVPLAQIQCPVGLSIQLIEYVRAAAEELKTLAKVTGEDAKE